MNKRILLADDSRTIQRVVKLCLADDAVEVAADAAGAMARVRQIQPDLLLVDHRLPGQDGYGFGLTLQQDDALAAIPRVLLYSAFGTIDEAAARAAGYTAWCPKPFDSQMLLDSIEAALHAIPAMPAPVVKPVQDEVPVVAEEAAAEFELADLLAGETEAEPASPVAVMDETGWLEPAVETAVAAEAAEEEGELWSDLSLAAEDLATEAPAPLAPAEDFQLEAEAAEVSADDFSFAPETVEPAAEFAFDTEPPATPAAPLAPAAAEPFVWEQPSPTAEPTPVSFELPQTEEFILDEAPIATEAPVLAEQVILAEEPFLAEEEVLDLDESDILAVEDVDWQPEIEAAAQQAESVMPLEEAADSIFSQVVEAESVVAPSPESFFFEASVEVPMATTEVRQPSIAGLEPAAVPASNIEPPAAPATATPAAPTADLEQQLRALPEADLQVLLERVAQPLLERIAWEVVPDLAESLIREEIRKIRETAA